MSFFDSEKLQAAQKSNLELLQQMNTKFLKGLEQLGHLQIATLRSVSEETFENASKLLAVRDPQSFTAVIGSLAHPANQAERMMEFNRQVYDLISSTQADIAKLGERQAARNAQQVQELVDEIAKNAPAGSDEKDEYYKQYSAAYSEYIKNGGKSGKTSYSYKADENKESATSAELYARYKKERDPEKKQELYDEYIKTYKNERSQAGKAGYDKNSGPDSKDDKNSSGAEKKGKKPETLADVKARTDRAYEKYKNAPADSEEKEKYYREYQREYQQYRAKLEEKPAEGETAGKHAQPYFAATGGYIADTPNTPVPAVSGGGGGGNVFKKLFRKAEQSTDRKSTRLNSSHIP